MTLIPKSKGFKLIPKTQKLDDLGGIEASSLNLDSLNVPVVTPGDNSIELDTSSLRPEVAQKIPALVDDYQQQFEQGYTKKVVSSTDAYDNTTPTMTTDFETGETTFNPQTYDYDTYQANSVEDALAGTVQDIASATNKVAGAAGYMGGKALEGAGDLLGLPQVSEAGKAAVDFGNEMSAKSQAYKAVAHHYNSYGDEIAELALLAALPQAKVTSLGGALGAFGEGAAYAIGSGETEGTAALTGGLNVALGGIAAQIEKAMTKLPADVQDVLKNGTKEEKIKVLREADVAKQLGVDDLIYDGGKKGSVNLNDLTTNIFEKQKGFDKLKGVKATAFNKYADTMQYDKLLQDVATQVEEAAQAIYKKKKAPMTAAYNKAKQLAESNPYKYPAARAVQAAREELDKLGLTPAEQAAILSRLQPNRVSTRAEKAAARASNMSDKLKSQGMTPKMKGIAGQIGKLKAEDATKLQKLEKELSRAKDARRKSYLQSQIDKLMTKAQGVSPREYEDYLTESQVINVQKNLKDLARGGGFIDHDPKAVLGYNKAADKFMEEMTKVMGSDAKSLKEFKTADKIAADFYKWVQDVPEFQAITSSRTNTADILHNVAKDPYRLGRIADKIESPEVKKQLAEIAVADIIRPVTERGVGTKSLLDFGATSNQLESLFNNRETRKLLKEGLGEDKYNQLLAYRNVSSALAPLMKDIKEVPDTLDYVVGDGDILKMTGRAVKTLSDYAGKLKNDLLEGSNIKWGSSRIDFSNKMVNRVIKAIQDSLEGKPFDTKALDALKALEQFTTYGAGKATQSNTNKGD